MGKSKILLIYITLDILVMVLCIWSFMQLYFYDEIDFINADRLYIFVFKVFVFLVFIVVFYLMINDTTKTENIIIQIRESINDNNYKHTDIFSIEEKRYLRGDGERVLTQYNVVFTVIAGMAALILFNYAMQKQLIVGDEVNFFMIYIVYAAAYYIWHRYAKEWKTKKTILTKYESKRSPDEAKRNPQNNAK